MCSSPKNAIQSLLVLIFLLLWFSGNSIAQEVYLFSDIDYIWHEKSHDHWTQANGYNNSKKTEINSRIDQELKQLNSKIQVAFVEHFSRMGSSVRNTDNPTTLFLDKDDFYFELMISLELSHSAFPFFHGNSFSGEVTVNYILTGYNAKGEQIESVTKSIRKDLKKDIKQLLTEKSNHYRDLESFLKLVEISINEGITGVLSNVKEKLIATETIDMDRFNQSMKLVFNKRRVEAPHHFRDFEVSTSVPAGPVTTQITQNDNRNVNAAFDDVQIAGELGDQLREVTNYALIIGIQDYQHPNITDLDHPVNDARRLASVLTSKYTFDRNNMIFLENPTRSDLMSTLDRLTNMVKPNSNLLIFYAGHGLWDDKLLQGYWMPTDADPNIRVNWLSNNDLVAYLRAIPSKHTLLIADACFSGGIFKTRDVFQGVTKATLELYKYPSRKAMTSGAMKTVPDRSVFLEYLVRRLEQNQKPFLSSEELFSSFKAAVINNSPNNQIPQFGEIRESGDEGGDFIFIKK